MRLYVFVYGTLKRCFSLHKYLAGSKFLGEAELSDYVTYDLGWYPRIKPVRGKIHGEVYE